MKFWKGLQWVGSLVLAALLAWAVVQHVEMRMHQGEQDLRPVPVFR